MYQDWFNTSHWHRCGIGEHFIYSTKLSDR